jgi:hypothetical protein
MLIHFGVNWLAVVLATVASMAVGFGWYTVFANQWMAAIGKTRDQIQGNDPTPYIWSIVVQFVMAYFVALLTPKLLGATSVPNAIQVAVLMWIGFVLTSTIQSHRYAGRPWSLTAIDGGYVLAALIVEGLVIGLFS